jgi:hypothetical protein
MRALLVLLALAAPAHARNWNRIIDELQAGAYLHYEVSGLTAIDDTPMADPHELVLAGARLHGFIGGATVAYFGGLDLAAGSTVRDGGFAYDVAFLPLGIALRLGKTGFVGVETGVAASGAVGTLDDAVLLPIEAVAEIGRGVRLLARARISYVAGADSRQSAAPSVSFADEFEAMLGLRVGSGEEIEGFPFGDGYFVAASYREMAHTKFAGVTFGFSIDLATKRKHRHAVPE